MVHITLPIIAVAAAANALATPLARGDGPGPGNFTGAAVQWTSTAAGDPISCGQFRTGDGNNLWDIAWDCKFGRGSNIEVPRTDSLTVRATKCSRIACWNTSGIYVCNDNNHDISVMWYDAGQGAMDIITGCCPNSRWHPQNHHAVSGMLGLKKVPGVNIIAAYGSCEARDDIRPGAYEGWGPNGRCW